jgi:uncharacterized protein YutE (UPF0331/DUF86 family)
MRLDLYQAETARIAADQSALMAEAKALLKSGQSLSPLEQSGVLHALQVLIENSIGKAKQLLKGSGEPVPVSGYDAFKAMANLGLIETTDLPQWNSIIGLRNHIIHDYMTIEMDRITALVAEKHEQFVVNFLLKPLSP